MDSALPTVVPTLAELRERFDTLSLRRRSVADRPELNTSLHQELETMRFELAELEWRLTELEAGA